MEPTSTSVSSNNPKLRIDFLMSPSPSLNKPATAGRKVKVTPTPTKQARRAGGWTVAELEYTFRLSADFKDGLLPDAPPGILLRQYLSLKLNCSPMRLSKKFDKSSGILGMHRYDPTASVLAGLTPEMRRARKKELKQLEEAFRKSAADDTEVVDVDAAATAAGRKRRKVNPLPSGVSSPRAPSSLDLLVSMACRV
ncbi:unnamed protein product [Aphanomyces euteiches]|uniref:Uncharacterized protein n=1 Tax=Aphanomyces euteiches TaxID=100861 RepID=A0A6G0X4T7_9STRA|nr:hypothetical protein Ae201684_008431 [Aphanomyces euteiches]KAH9070199.1 hypothetical protein Ae201684P_002567 [Aphanomyces euteiches]KAH9149871.1 hypothetical protein AeRB84_007187 [Aphanomyces euteiches]